MQSRALPIHLNTMQLLLIQNNNCQYNNKNTFQTIIKHVQKYKCGRYSAVHIRIDFSKMGPYINIFTHMEQQPSCTCGSLSIHPTTTFESFLKTNNCRHQIHFKTKHTFSRYKIIWIIVGHHIHSSLLSIFGNSMSTTSTPYKITIVLWLYVPPINPKQHWKYTQLRTHIIDFDHFTTHQTHVHTHNKS